MKGIVLNLLEQAVVAEHGEDTWDALLENAGLEGVYTSLGNYADADLQRIVGAASTALDTSPDQIVRWFGIAAIPPLVDKFGRLFAKHDNTRSFLLTLNDIIHPEVRKLYPGADTPDFSFDTSSEAVLTMAYASKRKLCMLAEGLIEGSASHFGETTSIEQTRCMNRGDDECVLRITLTPSS